MCQTLLSLYRGGFHFSATVQSQSCYGRLKLGKPWPPLVPLVGGANLKLWSSYSNILERLSHFFVYRTFPPTQASWFLGQPTEESIFSNWASSCGRLGAAFCYSLLYFRWRSFGTDHLPLFRPITLLMCVYLPEACVGEIPLYSWFHLIGIRLIGISGNGLAVKP